MSVLSNRYCQDGVSRSQDAEGRHATTATIAAAKAAAAGAAMAAGGVAVDQTVKAIQRSKGG